MPSKFSSEHIQFSFGVGPAAAATPREPEAPFVLAVLGDFTGRASRGVHEPVPGRKVWRVDCDNFEQVFGRLRPELQLALADTPAQAAPLAFGSMDDFHPDRLLRQIPALTGLLEKRKRLLDPATSTQAAAEMQALMTAPLPNVPEPPKASPASAESDTDTMSRLLGGAVQSPAPTPKPRVASGALDRIIKEAIGSSAVPGATPQQNALRSALEMELTNQLRPLLHQPHFQALEAAWRGLDLLVRNFGGEDNLKLCLIDVSKEELMSDLQNHESLASSGLWKIVEQQAQETPWAVCLGLYTFGDQLADLEALGRLAKVSSQARAPFISGASPALVGCDSFGLHPDPDDWKQPIPTEVREVWAALRKLPEARYLSLALPRFLLRLPYGQQTEAIDSFGFQELPATYMHEGYLWGNPAVLCGWLLASAFQSDGWDLQAGGSGEISDLPVHSFKEDGETKVKPCAEAWLTERASHRILTEGLVPVLSVKGRDAVRVEALQSLAGSDLPVG